MQGDEASVAGVLADRAGVGACRAWMIVVWRLEDRVRADHHERCLDGEVHVGVGDGIGRGESVGLIGLLVGLGGEAFVGSGDLEVLEGEPELVLPVVESTRL